MTVNTRRHSVAQEPVAQILAVLLAAILMLSACGDSSNETADGGAGAAPTVELTVVEDPMAGHNLFIDVNDFVIAPESASTDPVEGEGHLHLYVDGERVLRFYNTSLHLTGLEAGDHTVSVEVSQNDHSAYEVDGEPVRATETITVVEAEHSHGHSDVVDFEGDEPPAVEVTVTKDPKSGWNLSADIDNFTITPEDASTDPVDGEGHLHLYIDGEKITRLYGTDWHIAELSEGTHTIEVEVSHNDHSTYGIEGEPIRGAATVEVSAEEAAAAAAGHHHGNDNDSMEENMETEIPIDEADLVIEASVVDGTVTTDSDRYEIEIGSTVALVIEADTADQAHVHGFDHFIDVEPGQAGTKVFVADIPGLFEVELEGAGTLLFELQIS